MVEPGINNTRVHVATATRRQAGLGELPQGVALQYSTRGLLLRGVIDQVYRYDAAPEEASPDTTSRPLALYADVLCYTSLPGNSQWRLVEKCLILQPQGGVHDGIVTVPRGNTSGFGKQVDLNTKTSPVMMDGDHVLVGFMDDRPNLPVILGHIPHPRADTGVSNTAEVGERLHMLGADGNPRLVKHQGTYYGADANSNYLVNTTRAHKGGLGSGEAAQGGGYNAEGAEVANTGTSVEGVAMCGNHLVTLPPNAVLSLQFTDASGVTTNRITLSDHDGKLVLKCPEIYLGDENATEPAVLGDALNTWLTTPGGLSVSTAFGPSGPSINPLPGSPGPTGPSPLSGSVKVKE